MKQEKYHVEMRMASEVLTLFFFKSCKKQKQKNKQKCYTCCLKNADKHRCDKTVPMR